jgi:hypothetical protein
MRILIPVFLLILSFRTEAQFTGSVTQGQGTTTIANLMPGCASNHITPLGTITSTDSKIWVVPAETQFQTGPFASDLHNTCNQVAPVNLAAANLSNVPITEIDANGELITGFLFSDNYFELYINGVLVGVDAVPFTPFNSSVVKFRVSRPYTIAVKLVDWEEHPGLGSEIQAGDSYHPGDGGFIAQFSDGTVTNANWKAQTFYIAPLQNVNDVQELPNGTRSSANATLTPTCNQNCFAVHYPIPSDWNSVSFQDGGWPQASLYTAAQVTNQPAYTNFANSAWGSASFIWSSNLILDNLVLARFTVPALTEVSSIQKYANHFRIQSNPALKEFSIMNEANGSKPLVAQSLRIISATGIQMVEIKNPSEKTDIHAIPSGIYFVQFEYENQLYAEKLFVP